MRLFIAILLSEKMKNALINIQNEMYDKGIRGHFTPEENMHLTLAFIGEYPDTVPVTEALEAVAFTPFDISLEGQRRETFKGAQHFFYFHAAKLQIKVKREK